MAYRLAVPLSAWGSAGQPQLLPRLYQGRERQLVIGGAGRGSAENYREYLDGYSTDKISAGLERDGILTGTGNPRWHTSTVAKILRNEKYMGDALPKDLHGGLSFQKAYKE